jgi:hypothetical protein
MFMRVFANSRNGGKGTKIEALLFVAASVAIENCQDGDAVIGLEIGQIGSLGKWGR